MSERINLDDEWHLLYESIQEILNRNVELPDSKQGVIDLAYSDYTTFLNILTEFGEQFGIDNQQTSWITLNVAPRVLALLVAPTGIGGDANMLGYCRRFLEFAYHQFRYDLTTAANWFLDKVDEYRREGAAQEAEDEV